MTSIPILEAEIDRLRGLLKNIANNPHVSLGDLVYQVRDREGQDWDGPAVKAWSDVSAAIEKEFMEKRA